jgi:pSer/pThr/pTyr-binding forkhead associated (FHA) protein
MPKLQISFQDGADISHDLIEDVVTVGRIAENTIEIDDPSVSSHHAQLTLRVNDYIFKDLGSTNGSRLNGKDVVPDEEHHLRDGDRVQFGTIEAVYLSDTPSEQRAMPTEIEPVAVAAASSARPANFENASPFLTKKKKNDPVAMGIMAFAIFAMVVFAGAVATIFLIQPPS